MKMVKCTLQTACRGFSEISRTLIHLTRLTSMFCHSPGALPQTTTDNMGQNTSARTFIIAAKTFNKQIFYFRGRYYFGFLSQTTFAAISTASFQCIFRYSLNRIQSSRAFFLSIGGYYRNYVRSHGLGADGCIFMAGLKVRSWNYWGLGFTCMVILQAVSAKLFLLRRWESSGYHQMVGPEGERGGQIPQRIVF